MVFVSRKERLLQLHAQLTLSHMFPYANFDVL